MNVKINQSRFRVIKNATIKKQQLLTSLGFTILEKQAIDKSSKQTYLFIDNKRREFWIVDTEALKASEHFVMSVYNHEVLEIHI